MFCVTNLISPAKSSVSASKASKRWIKVDHGALRNTTTHWNVSRELSTNVYSRDPSRKVCFNPLHDGIAKIEGHQFRQEKPVPDGVKDLGKIKVNDINFLAFVHHTRSESQHKET